MHSNVKMITKVQANVAESWKTWNIMCVSTRPSCPNFSRSCCLLLLCLVRTWAQNMRCDPPSGHFVSELGHIINRVIASMLVANGQRPGNPRINVGQDRHVVVMWQSDGTCSTSQGYCWLTSWAASLTLTTKSIVNLPSCCLGFPKRTSQEVGASCNKILNEID